MFAVFKAATRRYQLENGGGGGLVFAVFKAATRRYQLENGGGGGASVCSI